MHYMVFDVLFWKGEDVTDYPYNQRIALFEAWARRHLPKHGVVHIPVNLGMKYSFDDLFGKDCLAVRENFEGYVIWDTLETTEVRFDGKEARRNCYKWKPLHTEDVWAEDPATGKGKNEGRLGKVKGYQFHDGEKIHVGDIGGGFTDEQRKDYWDRRDSVFPCVIEVETSERLPSMKLRFPVFKRMRPDKSQEECDAQLLPRNATRKDSRSSC